MQCFLCEICSTHAFPNANTNPKTKQKMPQQFQFLGYCRRRGAGLAGARLRHWTWTQDVGTAFMFEPLRCTRSVHPESSLLRKRRRGGCSFLPGGSIRNTVSLTPETDAGRSLSFREQVQHSVVPTLQCIWQNKIIYFIFHYCKELSRYAWFLSRVLMHPPWLKIKMADLSVWPLWLIYLLRILSPAVVLRDLASEKWHCWLSVTCKISVSIWKNNWRKEVLEIIYKKTFVSKYIKEIHFYIVFNII